jgi:hypothetical protein
MMDPALKLRYTAALLENKEICEAEDQLQHFIQKLEQEKANVLQDPSYSQFAYITHEDLKVLSFYNQ